MFITLAILLCRYIWCFFQALFSEEKVVAKFTALIKNAHNETKFYSALFHKKEGIK